MIAVGLFVPILSTGPAIAVILWRAPLLVGGAMRLLDLCREVLLMMDWEVMEAVEN